MQTTTTNERNISTRKLNRRDAVEALKRLAAELGRAPKAKECDECAYTPAVSTLVYRFGSYNKALLAAGISGRSCSGGKRQVYSKEDSVASLRTLAEELGRAPMALDCQKCSYTPSVNTLIRQSGKYNDALIAAGLTPITFRDDR